MDYYAAGWPYLLIGLTECVLIAFVYGFTRFLDDVKEIMGFSPNRPFRYVLMGIFMIVSPLVIGVSNFFFWFFKNLTFTFKNF